VAQVLGGPPLPYVAECCGNGRQQKTEQKASQERKNIWPMLDQATTTVPQVAFQWDAPTSKFA
jgi:hypothetical protein